MTLSPLKLRLLVGALLVQALLGAMDHTIVATSLATIAGELSALEHMSWVVVGYTLASAVLLPVLGKLGDLFGARTVFLASMIVFFLASLACGFSNSIEMLIVARVFQGMSSAGLQLMSQTILALVTTPRQRPKYMSIIGAAFPIAIVIGPFVGGIITDVLNWRWVFWINIPLGVVALGLALIALPKLERSVNSAPAHRFDLAGSVTFALAMLALVLGATWLPDPASIAAAGIAFGLAALFIIVFVVVEIRAAEPIIPFALFRHRAVWTGIALSAIVGIGLFSVVSYIPTYIQMAYQQTATMSGVVPIATVLGMLVTSLATGWLTSRTGRYWIYPIIGTTAGAAGLTVMAMLPVGSPLIAPIVAMAVVGLGTGCFMSLIVAIVQSAVPRSAVGSITASVNLVRNAGATLATAVIGGVLGSGVAARVADGIDASTLTPAAVAAFDPATQADIAHIYTSVLSPVFLALALVYVVGVVIAVALPRQPLRDSDPAEPVESHV